MNNSLVDPFVLAQDYPESLTGHLSKSLEPQASFLVGKSLISFRVWTFDLCSFQS